MIVNFIICYQVGWFHNILDNVYTSALIFRLLNGLLQHFQVQDRVNFKGIYNIPLYNAPIMILSNNVTVYNITIILP